MNTDPETPKQDIIHIVRNFWQGGISETQPWNPKLIGNSSKTFAGAGCLLTCLAIATNTLNKTQINPGQANVKATQANAIDSGGNTNISAAALALNLKAPENLKVLAGTFQQIKQAVDAALENGGLAILHVDFTGDTVGEHFILIHSRKDGNYLASDPAKGSTITLSPDLEASVPWSGVIKNYRPVQVEPIFKNS